MSEFVEGSARGKAASGTGMMMIFIGTLFCNLHTDANGLHLRQILHDVTGKGAPRRR